MTKGLFSWYAFLTIWKRLLFAGDGFAGAQSIDSAMLSVVHQIISQRAPWFRSIQLAASRKLRRNLFCFVSFTHTQSTSASKSAYFYLSRMPNKSKSGFGSSSSKASATLRENQKGLVLLLLLFHEWQNLAYDAVLSNQVWLQMDQRFRKISKNSLILIIQALAVTLTLKIVNQLFCMTHRLMIIHHHIKFCIKKKKKWLSIHNRTHGENIIQSNIHWHYEPSLWSWPWMQ